MPPDSPREFRPVNIAVLTVSDTRTLATDKSGGLLVDRLADAGGALAALATEAPLPDGAVYAALRKARITWPAPSTLAQDDGVMQALWADSAALCGEAP